jgi:hypothetical protein
MLDARKTQDARLKTTFVTHATPQDALRRSDELYAE